MGVTIDDPRSPLAWPRRRRSLRRRVAELERLLAEVENDAAQALAEQRSEVLALYRRLDELAGWRVPRKPFDHEPAVGRLLASEIEASERRTGSPT